MNALAHFRAFGWCASAEIEHWEAERTTCGLALEFESKAFSNAQLGTVQRQLEAAGYRVFDANAAPGSVHWESRWQMIEVMALRTGDDAPLRRVPGGLSCDGFVNGNDTYCCRVKTGWWRTRKPGQPTCT